MTTFTFEHSYSVKNSDQVIAVFIYLEDAKEFFNKVYNSFTNYRVKKYNLILTEDSTGEVINNITKGF